MGMRLHFAQHYDPQWQGGYFNWGGEQWDELFYAKFEENGWRSEDESYYEIQREDVKEYIADLKKLPGDDKNEFFPDEEGHSNSGYTNDQIIYILEEILTSDDDNIRLEFF